jgi:hypothetical protein
MPCDFTKYQDFVVNLSAAKPNDVQDASHLEVVTGGAGGANRLHIFTGSALVGFNAKDDELLRFGIVRVDLNFPISKTSQFVDAASNAALASIFKDEGGTGEQITYAVDCVSTLPEPPNAPVQQLVLTAALAIQGAGGKGGIKRMAYQANVQVRAEEVQLDSLLVSDTHSPPDFQPSARFVSGQPWLGRVILNAPAPGPGVFVGLASGDPSFAPVQVSVPVVGGQISADFTAPNTKSFTFPAEKDVTITASLNAIQKTATLKLLNIPI